MPIHSHNELNDAFGCHIPKHTKWNAFAAALRASLALKTKFKVNINK